MRRSSEAIQEELVTVRNDRFVIPVRSDHQARIKGVAHGSSSSGATVFIEPLETIEANNELQTLREAEQREIGILQGVYHVLQPARLGRIHQRQEADFLSKGPQLTRHLEGNDAAEGPARDDIWTMWLQALDGGNVLGRHGLDCRSRRPKVVRCLKSVKRLILAEVVGKQQVTEHLAAAGFTNVEMHLWPVKDVKVKRVRQVVPEIKDLPLGAGEGQPLVAKLGTLERDKPSRYILDLSLPKRPDGKYNLAQVEVSYDLGNGRRESTSTLLEMTYTAAGHGYINAEVARHIDEVQIFELNKNLQQAIATNNQQEAQRVAQTIEKKGEVMGPRAAKKTMLAKQVLQELNAGGRVSKKTQLAVDDVARMAEEMPAG